eukprot:TRINITY_DN942_c0_g1_i1.p2 TRINITY_DN942_c0_g1~~TRINITY_DN942_c0_g1_i1.p2  ORF type:complete len:170 (+),score=21.74 TRINITY_DN942_c0_g1_i1:146-655(+)
MVDHVHIQQVFNEVDHDNDGQIRAEELQIALKGRGLHFSLQNIASMIRLHDMNENDTMSLGEFELLYEFLKYCQNIFNVFDADEDGYLTIQETIEVIREEGYNIEKEALQTLVTIFDADHSSLIQMEEFIRIILFLRHASIEFARNDHQNSGQVDFTFGSFLAAAANCK